MRLNIGTQTENFSTYFCNTKWDAITQQLKSKLIFFLKTNTSIYFISHSKQHQQVNGAKSLISVSQCQFLIARNLINTPLQGHSVTTGPKNETMKVFVSNLRFSCTI